MFQKFASTAFLLGALLTVSLPSIGLAQSRGGGHGGSSRGFSGGSRSYGGGSRSFSGGSRSYGGGNYSRGYSGGGHSYVAPRGYVGGGRSYGRSYVAPRYYGGHYGSGLYFGFGAPYYDPYYYSPYVYAPPACTQGYYDAYGNWIPGNCAPPPQSYYDPYNPY